MSDLNAKQQANILAAIKLAMDQRGLKSRGIGRLVLNRYDQIRQEQTMPFRELIPWIQEQRKELDQAPNKRYDDARNLCAVLLAAIRVYEEKLGDKGMLEVIHLNSESVFDRQGLTAADRICFNRSFDQWNLTDYLYVKGVLKKFGIKIPRAISKKIKKADA